MSPVALPEFTLERELLREYSLVIACDEVGRGALAGPVCVGATVVDASTGAFPDKSLHQMSTLVDIGSCWSLRRAEK